MRDGLCLEKIQDWVKNKTWSPEGRLCINDTAGLNLPPTTVLDLYLCPLKEKKMHTFLLASKRQFKSKVLQFFSWMIDLKPKNEDSCFYVMLRHLSFISLYRFFLYLGFWFICFLWDKMSRNFPTWFCLKILWVHLLSAGITLNASGHPSLHLS